MAEDHLRGTDEQRPRRSADPSHSEEEYCSGHFEVGERVPSLTRFLSGAATLRGRGNVPVRADAIHSAQRRYGNRAVQRFVQRTTTSASNSNTSMRAVQRYHQPDEDWLSNTLESGQGMAGGMLGAIPIVGNLMNASMASVYTAGSAINYATGHDDDAKKSMHYAQNSLLNAIPVYGNIRSGAQGVHDAGAFYNNLFGGGSAPPEISRDIYARESGPILDRYLSSLF